MKIHKRKKKQLGTIPFFFFFSVTIYVHRTPNGGKKINLFTTNMTINVLSTRVAFSRSPAYSFLFFLFVRKILLSTSIFPTTIQRCEKKRNKNDSWLTRMQQLESSTAILAVQCIQRYFFLFFFFFFFSSRRMNKRQYWFAIREKKKRCKNFYRIC
jgi:hypothetical protein